MVDNPEFAFGNREQWQPFGERHRMFFERWNSNLRRVVDILFNREWEGDQTIDRYVFTAGSQTVDDFLEILLQCGNGEGTAAQKLLRPMFERVVTLKYLATHADELDLYLDFHWISQRKLVRAIESTFKVGLIDPATVKDIEGRAARVKGKYTVTTCEKCGDTRLNFTWTPKDMISMAKESGLEAFVVPCYYIPMQYTHPSVHALVERITMEGDEFRFRERLRPDTCHRVLCGAHALLLHAVSVQVDHFKFDEDLWKTVERDFMEVWKRDKVEPPSEPEQK